MCIIGRRTIATRTRSYRTLSCPGAIDDPAQGKWMAILLNPVKFDSAVNRNWKKTTRKCITSFVEKSGGIFVAVDDRAFRLTQRNAARYTNFSGGWGGSEGGGVGGRWNLGRALLASGLSHAIRAPPISSPRLGAPLPLRITTTGRAERRAGSAISAKSIEPFRLGETINCVHVHSHTRFLVRTV